MQVESKLFGPFRDDAGAEDVGGEYDPGTTVGELLRELEADYPSLEGRIVDPDSDGTVGSTVVSVNEKNITHLDGLATELEASDVVRIVPSVYGG
ncbi:ubiquitin-like small modifier protein 1 [Halolamina salifodinae]|uniref:Molybdopterin synthase sulfur carrier subunit n=1 Tax=Halolamina salifodinae TaxID=1202767 RepID=A0A8T4H1S1_9EURY|nr:ubiquitin-like small modifier protein 1 [Halolamina salifodinae]MBP1987734.1 molybdopterin synthase sulfur carrier subunit [Halolamina salifodinae]